VAGKFGSGQLNGNGCGFKGKAVSLFVKGSRFRETHFFSAGKKSKHADQRETMNTKKIKTSE
jgi:hypothetical protein